MGYTAIHTTCQTGGINTFVRNTIPCQKILEWEGRLLVVRCYDPLVDIITCHIPRWKTAKEVNDALVLYGWKYPALIFCDANQLQHKLEMPVHWRKTSEPTFFQGTKGSHPDLVGFYLVEGSFERSEKFSDHWSISVEAELEKITNIYSIFPYTRLDMVKQLRLHDRPPLDWPMKPIDFGIKSKDTRCYAGVDPEFIGNPKWTILAAKKKWLRLLKYWEERKIKDIWSCIHHNFDLSDSCLALYIKKGDEVRTLANARDWIVPFFENMYFCKNDPIGFVKPNTWMGVDADFSRLAKGKAISMDLLPDNVLMEDFSFEKDTEENAWRKRIIKFLLTTNHIPDYVKRGRLMLLSKTGSSTVELNNTRPITILSPIYKLIESSIIGELERLVWPHIAEYQRGFRRGTSTHTNIIDLKGWMNSMNEESNSAACILYVDIRKAFDHVKRPRLVRLLKKLGGNSKVVQGYTELLSNTTLQLGDAVMKTNVGVPQGALLSPMMFNLYLDKSIRELARIPASRVLAYADNVIVYGEKEALPLWERTILSWNKRNLFVEWHKCMLCPRRRWNANTPHLAPLVKSFNFLGVTISWSRKKPKNSLTTWRRSRRSRGIFRPTNVAFLGNIWFEHSLLHYNFFADFYLDTSIGRIIDDTFYSILRKKLRIQSFLSTEEVQKYFGFLPSLTMERRKSKIDGCLKEYEQPKSVVSRRLWDSISGKWPLRRLALSWSRVSYGISCDCLCKHQVKTHYVRCAEVLAWKRNFFDSSLLTALGRLEKLDVGERTKVLKYTRSILKKKIRHLRSSCTERMYDLDWQVNN